MVSISIGTKYSAAVTNKYGQPQDALQSNTHTGGPPSSQSQF